METFYIDYKYIFLNMKGSMTINEFLQNGTGYKNVLNWFGKLESFKLRSTNNMKDLDKITEEDLLEFYDHYRYFSKDIDNLDQYIYNYFKFTIENIK